MQPYIPVFVYHVAFGMPMLVDAIAEYLDELFKYRCLASVALLREFGGVVVVAVDVSIVLVVAILRAEDSRADTACEVLDVVFAIERSYVRAS